MEATGLTATKTQDVRPKHWYEHVDWFNMIILIGVPILGFIASVWTPLRLPTLIWSIVYYYATGLGITAGYHRLWSHCSYRASFPLQVFLALVGGGAAEGSIRWWSRGHRQHHRWTDTERDPYSVHKGLLYSHIGWLVMKQESKKNARIDTSDLDADAVVIWQHRNYLIIIALMSLVVPTLVAGFWDDWLGGFVYAGILRVFFVQQCTFCVNSLAHWFGEQTFDDRHSPRDHAITAFLSLGEGWHNFHHQFPSDFRNGVRWWQYDPSKWIIRLWKTVGLAYDLQTFPSNEIEKSRVQQAQKVLDRQRASLDWGIPIENLPVWSWDEYTDGCAKGQMLVAIAGVIHDVSGFVDRHPGGKKMIAAGIGIDATAMVNGGVHDHSNAAHNLFSTMRVASILGGGEVEVWKRKRVEEAALSEKSPVGTEEHITRVLPMVLIGEAV